MNLKKWLEGGKVHQNGYLELNADRLIHTLRALCLRIQERFPGSGLGQVAEELHTESIAVQQLVRRLQMPIWTIRSFMFTAILGLSVVFIGAIVVSFRFTRSAAGLSDFLQGTESAINEIILLALSIWFFVNLENRFKRRLALASLHRLRSITHVVDMHQLTKDPATLLSEARSTASSPTRTLTPYELVRYLDYCSELLSITSKLAALHVQNFNDAVVLSAVNDIETLTQGLSGKIWQKIMILDFALPAKKESRK
jgi:hypothetical protein